MGQKGKASESLYLLKLASSIVLSMRNIFQGNSLMRILNVAAFAVSGYASTEGRICKPFNPLLGETYEADYPDKGLRFFSEKVSVHDMQIFFVFCVLLISYSYSDLLYVLVSGQPSSYGRGMSL